MFKNLTLKVNVLAPLTSVKLNYCPIRFSMNSISFYSSLLCLQLRPNVLIKNGVKIFTTNITFALSSYLFSLLSHDPLVSRSSLYWWRSRLEKYEANNHKWINGRKIEVRELFGNVSGDYLKWCQRQFFLPFRNLWKAREHNLLVKGYTLLESFFISSGKTFFFHNCRDF